jgi:predicted DNA-binding transcriptional regulator AlpA
MKISDKALSTIYEVVNNPKFLKGLKREFDRSFSISVYEQDGKIRIAFEEKDSGHSVMTIGDVAAFLQCDRDSVRRMTGERAQRRSHHPIPFVKLGGKMLRFSRPAIEQWWANLNASPNGKNNTGALSLLKGKQPKKR